MGGAAARSKKGKKGGKRARQAARAPASRCCRRLAAAAASLPPAAAHLILRRALPARELRDGAGGQAAQDQGDEHAAGRAAPRERALPVLRGSGRCQEP